IYSRSGGSMGIGFAIPVSTARSVLEQIITSGSVTRGYIGVEPQDVTVELARAFRLPRTDGTIIAGVMRGGPADRAGVRVGDILFEMQGKPVRDTAMMLNMIAQLKPGTTARFRFLRDSRPLDLNIVIAKRPGAQRQN
ncbi:MAG: PDZ domain-containing protein, partial [Quisquiliibacterium sp.]